MFQSYIIGSIVHFRKTGSTEFDENNSGELVGIVTTSNKVIYLILDHSDNMIKEKGCGDFKVDLNPDTGYLNVSKSRCF